MESSGECVLRTPLTSPASHLDAREVAVFDGCEEWSQPALFRHVGDLEPRASVQEHLGTLGAALIRAFVQRRVPQVVDRVHALPPLRVIGEESERRRLAVARSQVDGQRAIARIVRFNLGADLEQHLDDTRVASERRPVQRCRSGPVIRGCQLKLKRLLVVSLRVASQSLQALTDALRVAGGARVHEHCH